MKRYPSIGCCGIDCALCPRFHTNGPSACPGCGAENFRDKHPSCAFLNCCVTIHTYEVCADCPEYPCKRFEKEKQGKDSFVTHRKLFENLLIIRTKGINYFICEQDARKKILIDFIKYFDDGRSKSFFCLSCTLLPINVLLDIKEKVDMLKSTHDIKVKAQQLRINLSDAAASFGMELKLRT